MNKEWMNHHEIDYEWALLILEALNHGITEQEIRLFLVENSNENVKV